MVYLPQINTLCNHQRIQVTKRKCSSNGFFIWPRKFHLECFKQNECLVTFQWTFYGFYHQSNIIHSICFFGYYKRILILECIMSLIDFRVQPPLNASSLCHPNATKKKKANQLLRCFSLVKQENKQAHQQSKRVYHHTHTLSLSLYKISSFINFRQTPLNNHKKAKPPNLQFDRQKPV